MSFGICGRLASRPIWCEASGSTPLGFSLFCLALQMYDDDFLTLTPEQLVSACRREGIMWIVIVKQGAGGRSALDEPNRMLKVKSVLRGYEEEGEF